VWLLPGYPQHHGVWTGRHPGLWRHILQHCPDGKYSTKVKLRRYPTLEEAEAGWIESADQNGCSSSQLVVHHHPVTDLAARRQSPSSARQNGRSRWPLVVNQHPVTDHGRQRPSSAHQNERRRFPLVLHQHPVTDHAARRQSPSSWLGAFVIRVWAWMRRQLRA
jgi:hypothetical protein